MDGQTQRNIEMRERIQKNYFNFTLFSILILFSSKLRGPAGPLQARGPRHVHIVPLRESGTEIVKFLLDALSSENTLNSRVKLL